MFSIFVDHLVDVVDKKWENCYISAPEPKLEKLKALSFLQLLKFEKTKCLQFFFQFWLWCWDIAIFSIFDNQVNNVPSMNRFYVYQTNYLLATIAEFPLLSTSGNKISKKDVSGRYMFYFLPDIFHISVIKVFIYSWTYNCLT